MTENDFPAAILKQREELDNKLAPIFQLFNARKDWGMKYARWLVIETEWDKEETEELKYALSAHHHFIGKVMGKPQTILFFLPEFE